MNYYPHNIGDFASLTQGLDLEAVGIVVRLLDRLMLTEKPIKTQWVSIGFPKEANDKVMAVLAALFEETPDGWIYPPAIEAIEAYQRNCLKNQENGKKGGRPRKTQQEPTGFSEETQGEAKKSLTNNQEPITNKDISSNEEIYTPPAAAPAPRKRSAPVARPEDVETQHWSDWLQTRKAKKLPLTQTALDGIRREAEKAGLSLDQAIAVCCERGWAGFKASWYEKDKTEQNVAPRGAEIKCSGQYYGEPGQIGWS
ncbi:DUF1376 domain-containing protein [Sutterella wadsworthensis]|uniref:DUF1376 domain-containing protein n=1 Tax=Sutterella wadsworthensis TaxID=40545 RepID=UPI003AF0A6D7